MKMLKNLLAAALLLVVAMNAGGASAVLEPKPADPSFEKFVPLKAPVPKKLLLKRGDRLAICGDSITEQKMYSRIMEDYLTMCVPELEVTVRQLGWSGERASGFLARMTNDCLRFWPTIATTCYGMNDHEYRPYEERIGLTYRANSRAIVRAFKDNGVRVVLGSPGCVGKMPHWVKSASGTVPDLNLSLCNLRNIGLWIAQEEKVGFADVFWPMYTAAFRAQQLYGTNYAVAGTDGVHPGWAGHTLMAYAFLKAFGLDGQIGTFTVDLGWQKIKVSSGHKVLGTWEGEYHIRSSRYPFCGCVPAPQHEATFPVCATDDLTKDSSVRSAMTLVPFNRDLNRLMLVARHGRYARYQVTWGGSTKEFTAEQLASGVNLAEEFPSNPFCEAFSRVDAAVAAKQAFETRQIKKILHGPEGKADMEAAAAQTERERTRYVAAIQQAFQPVDHTLIIRPF